MVAIVTVLQGTVCTAKAMTGRYKQENHTCEEVESRSGPAS